MEEPIETKTKPCFLDKVKLERVITEQFKQMGIPEYMDVAPEEAQAMSEAGGIKPEDNEISRGIIAARYEGWEDCEGRA